MTITIKDLEDYLDYANKTNAIGFRAGDDLKKARLGWEYSHYRKRLNQQQLDYLCSNFIALQKLKQQGNLSTAKLARFIQFFHKNNTDLNTVVFNRKVKITPEICKQKLIETLHYDVDNATIKIGNVDLSASKIKVGVYDIFQYVGKEFAKQSGDLGASGYNLLFQVNVPGLQLLPVDW